MSKFIINERPLCQYAYTSDDLETEDATNVIHWLENHSTRIKGDDTAYLLWVPSSPSLYKTEYGEDIPSTIYAVLESRRQQLEGEKDSGYIMIVFI